jgi:tRNA nucleotidyltransferase (CCA-adding enzyme)
MTDERVAAIDAELARALPDGALYAVGGRVRDEVRCAVDGVDRPAKDLDYVVLGVPREDLMERLRGLGPADVFGASFAVVKVVVLGESVDVALPRRERSIGVRHRDFAVDSGPDIPLEDDLARRDFRMNMMARRIPDGRIVDPYYGEADVRARRIDILGARSFDEDPLRMLRACQFAARFEFDISERTMEAMRAAAPLVATVSAERIRDELGKFVTAAARPSIGIEAMRVGGLLPFVLPEVGEGIGVEQNEYHAFDVFEHNVRTLDASPPGDFALRFAALLHDVGKPRTKDGAHFYRHELVGAEMAAEIAARLRFPNEVAERIVRLVRNHMYAADAAQESRTIRRFIRRIGTDLLDAQFALRAADVAGSGLPKRGEGNEAFETRVRSVLAERPALSTRDLAIDGRDVIAALVEVGRLPAGSRGGPEVGLILGKLLEQVTDDPARNEHDRLLSALAAIIGDGFGRVDVSRETEATVPWDRT